MSVKQVIVMRTDLRNKDGLKVRTGKLLAQAGHASSAWMKELLMSRSSARRYINCEDLVVLGSSPIAVTNAQMAWLEGLHTKVALQVGSDEELMTVFEAARSAGLTVHMVVDAGLTEFDGPTRTCLAIGPDKSEDIDRVTGSLKLY